MVKLYITYGCPRSGKTTWAKELRDSNPNKVVRVNKDDLRAMMHSPVHDRDQEKLTISIRDKIIENALRKGKDVIVDDTNFPFGGMHYQRMLEIARLVGDVEVIEKFFDADITELIKRNKESLDGKPVPEAVIYNMYNKYIKGTADKYQFKEVYFPKIEKIKYNPNLPDCVYLDIDGTISEMGDRSPYDWNKVYLDSCNENIGYITRIIRTYNEIAYRKIKVFIFTGRDGSCLEMTEKWLDDCDIYYHDIFIRPAGNTEKDSIIKERIYKEYIEGKYNLLFGVDDRNSVVNNFRSLGLTILQCNNGDF